MKGTFHILCRGEKGQAAIMAIVLVLLTSLILSPLLALMRTGIKSTEVYQKKTDQLYAADAGIQDASWRIRYSHLDTLSPAYDPYDFSATWSYSLPGEVNAKPVTVTVQNIWIPKGLDAPPTSQAHSIIDADKLTVTGSGDAAARTYTIKITYLKGASDPPLAVQSVGVWLPRGYTYDVSRKGTFDTSPSQPYYALPVVEAWGGNQAIHWSFSSVAFTSFPGVNPTDSPMLTQITIPVVPPHTPPEPDDTASAVAWLTTSGVADIPFSWNADVKVYRLSSQSGDTSVESYIAKDELRELAATIAGDYIATGNTLMIDTNHDSYGIRDQLLSQGSATVNAIPADAEVSAAYLYWSGWRASTSATTIFSDTCGNFNNWTAGSAWSISSSTFRGRYASGAESVRYVTLNTGRNLASYGSGLVSVSWDQWESGTLGPGDGLDFAFSGDGGITWSMNMQAFRDDIGSSAVRFSYSVPALYQTANFKIRFYLAGFSGSSMYYYVDNISVSAMMPDSSMMFKIDGKQVHFDADGNPQQGPQELTGSRNQVLNNMDYGNPHGFSYSCSRDVTRPVRTYSAKAPDPATNYSGNATYTVGNVTADTGDQWSYAGWSIIIIYTSAQTQGHQLYLYDKFTYSNHDTNTDFDGDGQPGGDITGFIVPNPVMGETDAAKLTAFVGEGDGCFTGDQLIFNGTALSNSASPSNNVWNSSSPGLAADGMDIDTFSVTWASNLLRPGDTSAHIDIPTQTDIWNMIYIIISFRSSTTTGGPISYLIHG